MNNIDRVKPKVGPDDVCCSGRRVLLRTTCAAPDDVCCSGRRVLLRMLEGPSEVQRHRLDLSHVPASGGRDPVPAVPGQIRARFREDAKGGAMNKGEPMTVQEWFEGERIYREDVDAMAEESEYSANASKFIGEKWGVDTEDLTAKQSDWAGRILDDMVERRIEGRR